MQQAITSILDYPDRGAGGRWNYRGNFSPRLIEDLAGFFKPGQIADPMGGSFTTQTVAERLGVSCWSSDLSKGFDIRHDEIPVLADLVVLHPPYWDIVRYSGVMWGKAPDPRDLSQAPDYPTFLARLNEALYAAFQAVRPGGRLVVVVGDVKRKGVLYPIQRDMRWYGTPEYHLIKTQHNTGSENRQYSGKFIPIMHEHVIVTKRDNAWFMGARTSEIGTFNLRSSVKMTWMAVTLSALVELGGKASLTAIYEEVAKHTRAARAAADGIDWQAIVRQKLQFGAKQVQRGIWALPVCS